MKKQLIIIIMLTLVMSGCVGKNSVINDSKETLPRGAMVFSALASSEGKEISKITIELNRIGSSETIHKTFNSENMDNISFDNLRAGQWNVIVNVKGKNGKDYEGSKVVIIKSRETTSVSIRLSIIPGQIDISIDFDEYDDNINYGALRGLVQNNDGKGIAGAKVVITNTGGKSNTAITDISGEYMIHNLPYDNYEISVSHEKHMGARKMTSISIDSEDIAEVENVTLGDLYYIVIGVGKHPETNMISDLQGAPNDAIALSSILNGLFNVKEGKLLIDEYATKSGIKEAITETLSKMNDNDFLIVTFSGHGTYNYIIPSDVQLFGEKVIPGTYINADSVIADYELYSWFDVQNVKQSQIIMVIDSCHSESFMDGVVNPLSFLNSEVNLMVAAGVEEESFESGAPNSSIMGLFSRALLEGLGSYRQRADINRDNVITLGEWFEYANDVAHLQAMELLKNYEKPPQRAHLNSYNRDLPILNY